MSVHKNLNICFGFATGVSSILVCLYFFLKFISLFLFLIPQIACWSLVMVSFCFLLLCTFPPLPFLSGILRLR